MEKSHVCDDDVLMTLRRDRQVAYSPIKCVLVPSGQLAHSESVSLGSESMYVRW